MASLSPQFTEHPPQLPRGFDGGALQELTWPSRSAPGVAGALARGGPVSPDAGAGEALPLPTQAVSDRAMSTPAASDALDKLRQPGALTSTY
jgi:hypothetical protein